MKYKIDVYIVDDHAMFNQGLADVVNHSDTVHVSRCFTTLSDCRLAMAERCPDVLLLDISVPERQRAAECGSSAGEAAWPDADIADSIAFCQWVVSAYPKVRVVAVTIHDEYGVIRRMLDSGAHGYVLKSAPIDQLITAIEQVWKGQRYISPEVESILQESADQAVRLTIQEQNILRQVCEGRSNAEIAERLHLSTETVKWYRKRLLAKFGVKNTVSLVALVLKEHILPYAGPTEPTPASNQISTCQIKVISSPPSKKRLAK